SQSRGRQLNSSTAVKLIEISARARIFCAKVCVLHKLHGHWPCTKKSSRERAHWIFTVSLFASLALASVTVRPQTETLQEKKETKNANKLIEKSRVGVYASV